MVTGASSLIATEAPSIVQDFAFKPFYFVAGFSKFFTWIARRFYGTALFGVLRIGVSENLLKLISLGFGFFKFSLISFRLWVWRGGAGFYWSF